MRQVWIFITIIQKKDQLEMSEKYIIAAQEKLPLIVHTRPLKKSEIFKKYKAKKDFKILIHCFLDQKNCF